MTLTEIVVVMDRSGSMQNCASDHSGGLNQFIKDQRQLEGDVNVTIVQFDDVEPFELVYDRVPIQKVNDITLNPRGCTPLLDSLGKTIGHISGAIEKDSRKPDQVIFMVITDGYENASKEFKRETIRSLIGEKEDKEKTSPPWNFLYLGANIDTFGEASSVGISNLGNVANFSNDAYGVMAAYSGTNCAVSRGREAIFDCGQLSIYERDYDAVTSAMAYTEEEKASFTNPSNS